MSLKNIIRYTLIAILAVICAVLTAGCKGVEATDCTHGQCVTTSVGPAQSPRDSQRAHSPVPVQSTLGASPSIPGLVSPGGQ